jgi:hypothetical protein
MAELKIENEPTTWAECLAPNAISVSVKPWQLTEASFMFT